MRSERLQRGQVRITTARGTVMVDNMTTAFVEAYMYTTG